MTLEEYVKTIIKRPNITKAQAKMLGIEYPLVKGWFDLHKQKIIEDPKHFFSLSTEKRKLGKGQAPKPKTKREKKKLIPPVPNGMAELLGKDFILSKAFYQSKEWKALRYSVLCDSKGKCELCGRSRKDGVILHVDHIFPRSTHWKIALNVGNLQILCDECNLGKSNKDCTDWR